MFLFLLQVLACKWSGEEGDGLLYRAAITAVNDKVKKVKVQFIDFGNRLEPVLSF